MENSKIIDALKMAILMERKGHSFYHQVAKQTSSTEIRHIFETMANEEVLHEKFLSDQYKEITQKNFLVELILPSVDVNNFSDTVLTDKIKREISAASYEAAAISAAIDMESNAIRVYSEYAKNATDKNEKQLFEWLANWERSHHEILVKMDNDLKESIWFDNQFWPF